MNEGVSDGLLWCLNGTREGEGDAALMCSTSPSIVCSCAEGCRGVVCWSVSLCVSAVPVGCCICDVSESESEIVGELAGCGVSVCGDAEDDNGGVLCVCSLSLSLCAGVFV